jgi:pimeloyl-ACP methyl ester carboxylesterase
VGGAPLALRAWGEPGAPAVVCWHGVGLASRASLVFAEAGPLLAEEGLRVLGLDAPGFGRSPEREPDAYRPHALADLGAALLDALGIVRAAWMGFSWGGDVVCHLAARHPDRVTALILLDAGYGDPPLDPSLSLEARIARLEEGWRTRSSDPPRVPYRVVAAVEHGMAQAPPSATRPAIARSGLAVLLLAAAVASDSALTRYAADVPQADVRRVDDAGHDVLADGGPELVRSIGAWLRPSAR